MRIDLHTHSSASDGTDRPAELVRAAARAGLDVVALTDHDTTAGWDEAAAALPDRLRVLQRGIAAIAERVSRRYFTLLPVARSLGPENSLLKGAA